MNKFLLVLQLEKEGHTPDVAEIMESIELGTFDNEDDARACMNLILDAAEVDVEDSE